jgi:hypothetical protein
MSTATARVDLRRDPARSAKPRALAVKSNQDKALSAYASIAPVVVSMRADAKSLGQIAEALNAGGLKTRNGAQFRRSTVARILARASG